MSKINEYLSIIQEDIEARCSNLMGKEIGAREMHRLEQAARLAAKKLNLKQDYSYEEMHEILGSEEALLRFKFCINLRFRFLVPTVTMDGAALVIRMDIDPVVMSTTVLKSSDKPLFTKENVEASEDANQAQ